MKFKFKFLRKGFTLVELLIVIIVIGVLAAMLMMSSSEAVSSAKAAAIINNLTEFKIAVNAWYTSNFYKIKDSGSQEDIGKVQNQDGRSYHPIQEYPDSYLKISKFFSNNTSINLNNRRNSFEKNTNLQPGCYGVYDAGGPSSVGNTDRRTLFVGYRFKDDELAVKKKLAARAASLKLYFTWDSDPYDLKNAENVSHYNEDYDLEDRQAVWMYTGVGPAPQWPDGGKLAQ